MSSQAPSRINIRLSSKELRALQKRALAEGMPYQTLVSSVLHKLVEGQMVERGNRCDAYLGQTCCRP
jgi:hypothetical protein